MRPKGGKRQPRGRTGEEEREGKELPEVTVAGCGERDDGFTEVTNEKMEEGEQQFDLRPVCVSSSTLQVCLLFSLQSRSFRTSWDPRRRLASRSRPSRM